MFTTKQQRNVKLSTSSSCCLNIRWVLILIQSLVIMIPMNTMMVASSESAKPSSSSNIYHHNRKATTAFLSKPLLSGVATRSIEPNHDNHHHLTDDNSEATTFTSSINSALHGIHRQNDIVGIDSADDEVLYVRKFDGSKEPLDGNKVRCVVCAYYGCIRLWLFLRIYRPFIPTMLYCSLYVSIHTVSIRPR